MEPSRGSQRLAQIVAESTQGAVAKTIGVSQQTVSDWLRGNMKPRGKNMLRLSERLKIEPAQWFEKPQPPSSTPTPTATPRAKKATPKRTRATRPGPVKARTKRAPKAQATGTRAVG